MVTYTFATPVAVGGLGNPITIRALQVTNIWMSTTPALAPIGTAELDVTLTDPVSGFQETISYQDATVLTFLAEVPTAPTGTALQDVVAVAALAKLQADGKIPAGTASISAATTTTLTASAASIAQGASLTLTATVSSAVAGSLSGAVTFM